MRLGPWSDAAPFDGLASTGGESDVLVVGSGVAGVSAALYLQKAGCRVRLLLTHRDSPCAQDLGVGWPDLSEHWSVIEQALGESQTEALIELVKGSAALLRQNSELCSSGAVLQLGPGQPEWEEMTARLAWVSERSPRRLMSGGAATNYLSLGQLVGAAFVPDCPVFEPGPLLHSWIEQFCAAGGGVDWAGTDLKVGEGASGVWVESPEQRWNAEMVLLAAGHLSLDLVGYQRNWLFPLQGTGFAYQDRYQEAWNRSLVGVQAHRGHWYSRAHPEGYRLVVGIASGADWEACSVRRVPQAAALRQLQRWSEPLLPGLLVVPEPTCVWAPLFTYSSDGLPLLGPLPGSARTWIAAGFAARSWSLGPACGAEIAREISGEGSPLLRSVPSLRPHRMLRPSAGSQRL